MFWFWVDMHNKNYQPIIRKLETLIILVKYVQGTFMFWLSKKSKNVEVVGFIPVSGFVIYITYNIILFKLENSFLIMNESYTKDRHEIASCNITGEDITVETGWCFGERVCFVSDCEQRLGAEGYCEDIEETCPYKSNSDLVRKEYF